MKRYRRTAGFEALSDSEAMERAGQGHPEAFEILVRRYQDDLLNFFRRMGVNSDAEDLVQESFVRIYRHRQNYQPTAKFLTFLYAVARSVWIDWVRRQSRRRDLLTHYAEHLAAREAGNAPHLRSGPDVQAAVESLSEKLRLVVVMSIYQGLKYEEIAEALHIPVGTVKSRMSLAFSQLREFIYAGTETGRAHD